MFIPPEDCPLGEYSNEDRNLPDYWHNGKKCVAVLTTSPRFQRADKGVN